MQRGKTHLTGAGRYSPVLPLIAFFAIACLLLPFYRYELSPDGISYLSLAQEYVDGYWREAINAYWGPLYCWFIAVLLLVHVPALVAAKLVNLGAGLLAIWALHLLCSRYDMKASVRSFFLWTAVLVLLGFFIETNTPDLLFTALLLLYVAIIFDPDYPSTGYAGVACGALGAFAYLAKSYGFFFFAAHFTLFSGLHWIFQRNDTARHRIVNQFFAGLAVFLVVSLAWVTILHAKYRTWTLSTTGNFNHRLVGPESPGYPHFRHLFDPPTEHAVTAWQDPSPSWLPVWKTAGNLRHEGKLIYGNAKSIVRFWIFAVPLFAAILIAYPVLCLRSADYQTEWIFPILTIALFCGGYLLITVQDRYIWFADLLLLWIAFRALDLLFKEFALTAFVHAAALVLVVLSFLAAPLRLMRGHFLTDRNLYESALGLKQSVHAPARLASCADWQDSAYLAYILGVPYYGVPAAVPEADEVARDLNPDYQPTEHAAVGSGEISSELFAARIDYFVEWPACVSSQLPKGSLIAKTAGFSLVRLKWRP